VRRLQTLFGYVGTENSRHSGHTQSGENSRLFNYLVGAREQRSRHRKTEHPGGPEIDDQLELRWWDDLACLSWYAIDVIGVYLRVLTAFASK